MWSLGSQSLGGSKRERERRESRRQWVSIGWKRAEKNDERMQGEEGPMCASSWVTMEDTGQ